MLRLEELDYLINSIHYNQLWDGFSKTQYALYNEENFYLNDNCGISLDVEQEGSFFIGKTDERFNGNTVTSIDDHYIAIFDEKSIPDDIDNKRLASLFVHEMFHCFQDTYGEKRFPNELLNINYPITIENIKLRVLERQYLLYAITDGDASKRNDYLNLFFSARRKREQLIGNHLEYEKAIESVEGTAVFVEYEALKQLTGDDGLSLTEYIEGYIEINESSLEIRRSTYHQGLLLCLAADMIIPNWKSDFANSDLFLSDFIYSSLEINLVEIDDKLVNLKEIEGCVSSWNKQRDLVFEEFEKSQSFNMIEQGFKITAFDPMNIVVRKQEIIHKNFLKVKVGDCEQVIKGPVKTIIGDHVFDVKKIIW